MIGTINCIYETPCGWCSKWDKKCDKKIPERGQREKCNLVDDAIDSSLSVDKVCQLKDHEWECTGVSSEGFVYTCKKCLAQKTVYGIKTI